MVVATPFPPLNRRNIEKLCPAIAEIMAPTANNSRLSGGAINKGNNAAINPLRKSKPNTVLPAFFPRIRFTLVAPGLQLPTLKISMPRRLQIKVANEIDPNRYPTVHARMICRDICIVRIYNNLRLKRNNQSGFNVFVSGDFLKSRFAGRSIQIDHIESEAAHMISTQRHRSNVHSIFS